MKTPEREQEMLFSLYPMAQTKVAIVKRPGDTRYTRGSLAGLAQAAIGVRDGTADTRAFEQWMQKSGLAYQERERPYPNRSALLAALDAGTIDLAATSYEGEARQYPAVQEFAPQAMYFAVAPTRPDLSAALDRAMELSYLYNASFPETAQLLTQPESSQDSFFLTDDEKAYLATLPTLRVALLADTPPLSYTRDGAFCGIAPRILARVADLTGLSFQFVPYASRAEAIAAIHEGRADLLGATFLDLIRSHAEGLRLTAPYYSGSAALLARTERKDAHIATSDGTLAYLPPERKADPDLVVYDYASAAIRAFADGQVDAVYCDTATASYYLAALGHDNASLKVLPTAPIQIGLAIDAGADPRLGLVLDRVLGHLADTETDEIVQQEAANTPLTLATLLDRLTGVQRNSIMAGLLLLLCAMAYFAYVAIRQRGIEQRALAIAREQETMAADLAWEKKIGAAQMDFYLYLDANLLGPLCAAARALAKKGAADEKSPFHGEFIRTWQMLDFLFEIRTLNALTQEDPGALARERHSPFYQPDPDWQPTPCRTFLEHQGAIVMPGATRRGLTFGVDFSGVLDTLVLVDRRGLSMVIMRLLHFLMKETPAHGVVLFSAALSRMAAENGISIAKEAPKGGNYQSFGIERESDTGRAVLWLFFTAPQLRLAPAFLQGAEAMRASVLENPRNIYESLTKDFPGLGPEKSRQLLRLAILQLIIPGLGGEWEIHSTEEKGTEVTVEFLLDLAKD